MIGIIADIHGNYPALLAVVSELKKQNITNIICLGDICGYYPWVNECLELVKSLTQSVVIGNHDYYIINNIKCPRSNSANACLDYQRKIIKPELVEWLASKPEQAIYYGINCVHGGWNNHIDEYLKEEDLQEINIKEHFAVSAHTHIPFIKQIGKILYCNPGSVGQPRDGNPKASYTIFDGKTFEIKRISYDWKAVQNKMLECGFDKYYTENLEFGYRIGYKKNIKEIKMEDLKQKTMITFNKPFIIENELKYIKDAVENQKALRGDGAYTKKCHEFLEQKLNCKKALLTHSCTAALEMAAILLDMKPGDEVIMPSFTFVSTANAFVLRGAVPVFVDIRPDTQNINEDLIEDAITPKTKAICCVHYAGVACDMDKILDIAKRHNLYVVEDAAQALGSTYKGKPLGTIGDLGCFSFHETKNIISGEGGAIIINNEKFIERSEIIREKGTNRSKFFRGQVDKYTWVDIGSSFLPSDMIAAFLYSQLENMDKINEQRIHIWNYYDKFFQNYNEIIKRPVCPKDCKHNAHMYYIMFKDLEKRTKFIDFMKENGVVPAFHYIPLHSSPAGKKYCRVHGSMTQTDNTSDTLVRLPMFYELDDKSIDYILEKFKEFFKEME